MGPNALWPPTNFFRGGWHGPRGPCSNAPHVQLPSMRNDLCTRLYWCTAHALKLFLRQGTGLNWIAAISEDKNVAYRVGKKLDHFWKFILYMMTWKGEP